MLLVENRAGNIIDWTMSNGIHSGYHGTENAIGYSVKT
jgi:hypothetical protein